MSASCLLLPEESAKCLTCACESGFEALFKDLPNEPPIDLDEAPMPPPPVMRSTSNADVLGPPEQQPEDPKLALQPVPETNIFGEKKIVTVMDPSGSLSNLLEVRRPSSPAGSINDVGKDGMEFRFRYLVIPCVNSPAQTPQCISSPLGLDILIENSSSNIQTLPPNTPLRFVHLNTLAQLLHVRYIRHHEHKDLALAITYRRRCLKNPFQDNFHLALSHLALAKLYHSLFHHCRMNEDLSLAIRNCQIALSTLPSSELTSSTLRALIQRELGLLYACRYADASMEADLRESYRHLRESVQSMASNDPERSSSLTYVIHVLLWHFNEFGASEDTDYLDVAVNYQKEAVDVVGEHTAGAGGTTAAENEALSASTASFLDDAMSDVDRSSDSLVVVDPNPPAQQNHSHSRSSALAIYAELLRQRFEYAGHPEDLKDATDRAQDALDLTPPTCSYYAKHLTLYVRCLMTRFRALGRLDDINRAYELHRELELNPGAMHALQSDYLHSFANLWVTAFEWFREERYLSRAIGLLQSAVRDYLGGDTSDRAELLHDLGKALSMRFECTKNLYEIEDAIMYGKNAVERTPPSSDKKQYRLLGLASSLSTRFECLHQIIDIDEAIVHQRAALESLKGRTHLRVRALSSLGHSLLRRWKYTKEAANRESAIRFLREAAIAPYGLPHDCLRAALIWATFMHEEGNKSADANALLLSLEGYEMAIRRLLPRVAWVGLNASSRLIQLRSVPPMLASDAAACAFRIAELSISHRQIYIERAVELLDWGRSILWSQSAQFRAELQVLHAKRPELAAQLNEVAQKLDQTGLDDTGERERQDLVRRWEELSIRVRCHHGFEHFNSPMPFGTLRRAASGSTSVVIVNVSSYRCDALIIPPGSKAEVKMVPLPDLTADGVQWMVDDFVESMSLQKGSRQMRAVLYDLWDKVSSPILQNLPGRPTNTTGSATPDNLPHVRWCLTGQLAFLPIHASYPRPHSKSVSGYVASSVRTKDGGVLDRVVSSYIPTLSALVRIENLRRQPSFQLLAVTHSHVEGYAPLQCAEEEVELLHTLPGSSSFHFLANSEATVSQVSSDLRSSNWVHFACHGQQNASQPMQSSLVLHDGQLYMSKIAERPHAGEFAMLLACESAKGASGFSDEALHMAASLHFSGFRSVVATMWSIRDDYGPIVARKVYEYLFRSERGGNADDGAMPVVPDSTESAYALHLALLHLRDVKKSQIREWAPFIHFGI